MNIISLFFGTYGQTILKQLIFIYIKKIKKKRIIKKKKKRNISFLKNGKEVEHFCSTSCSSENQVDGLLLVIHNL